jgi:hypothetical protein
MAIIKLDVAVERTKKFGNYKMTLIKQRQSYETTLMLFYRESPVDEMWFAQFAQAIKRYDKINSLKDWKYLKV